MSKIFALPYFVTIFSIIDTAKILGIFPTPSVSHQIVFRVLTQELVKRGHEVVVITTDPAFPKGQAPANLTEIDVHDLSYNFIKNLLQKTDSFEYGKELPWIKLEQNLKLLFPVMDLQIKSPQIQNIIQEKNEFDILLIEAYMRPALAYTYLFKAPIILVSSFGATPQNLEAFGASTHPILYPTPFSCRLYNLSLWEKLKEYYYHVQYAYLKESLEEADYKLMQQMVGQNVPSLSELDKNVDMLFLNVHPIWMNNQPVPPSIIFTGGLHQNPVTQLPQELKSYLDSSTNGVIYVSFGTNVLPVIFPTERLKIITEALSELPYDILFRWTGDELSEKTNNIKVSKWVPQSDLLRHPKVKAFVMQGGLQSTDEAITAGVPLVCIPMISDQWYNAEKIVHLKIGLKLDLYKLTKTELKNAIETVITDSSYRENIVKLREVMNDQQQSPLERAVWWVEYVLRHGGVRHLHTPAANMSWAQYYELQLVLIVLACLLPGITIGSFTVIGLWRYITQILSHNLKIKQS